MSKPADFSMRFGGDTANAQQVELLIYDSIGPSMMGDGVSAKDVAQTLAANKGATEIAVRINSRGGSVIDATAIYNVLTQHPARKVVYVEGVAASAASLIAMAGDEIRIADNALMMIHDPLVLSGGRASDLRKSAALLDKMRDSIAGIYAARTKTPIETIKTMMAEETWMDAQEAVLLGFATSVIPGVAAVALDLSCFKNPPQRGEAKPAPSLKESTMITLDQFKSFAGEHPEAVASYVAEGKKSGIADGRTEAKATLKSLIESAKGDSKLAVDAFLNGKDADVVAAVVAEREAQATASAKALADKDAEIAKLKAQVGSQGAVGHVPAEPVNASDKPAPANDPKAAAKAEWDAMAADAREAWVNEKTFVSYRAREFARA